MRLRAWHTFATLGTKPWRMGSTNYLIEGVPGAGKTSVCTELQRRGFETIHGDRELAYRGDPKAGVLTFPGCERRSTVLLWVSNRRKSASGFQPEHGPEMTSASFVRRFADPAALFAQANQHLAAGAYGPAETLLGQVLALLPKHPGAGFNLAWLLAKTGRSREASHRLSKLLKTHPDDGNAHALMARLQRRDGHSTRSLYHFRRALALAPHDLSIWLDAIALLGDAGRLDEARVIAEQALSRFADRPEIATQLGLVLLHHGCKPEARAAFEQALRIDPDFALANYNLATIHDDAWNIGVALRLYRHALAHDTKAGLPEINLGDIELRLGEVDAAIASNDTWLRTHPADPGVISNRLMAAQYVPGVTAASLRVLHDALWEGRVAASLTPQVPPHLVTTEPDRPLRVGLVGGDLRAHPGSDPRPAQIVGVGAARSAEARAGRAGTV